MEAGERGREREKRKGNIGEEEKRYRWKEGGRKIGTQGKIYRYTRYTEGKINGGNEREREDGKRDRGKKIEREE